MSDLNPASPHAEGPADGPTSTLKADLVELGDTITEFVAEGSRPRSDSQWVEALRVGRLFESWLAERGTTIEKYRADVVAAGYVDGHGLPIVPAATLVVWWTTTIPSGIKTSTARQRLNSLKNWFRSCGWSLIDVASHPQGSAAARQPRPPGAQALAALITRHAAANPESTLRVPARPVLIDDAAALSRQLDAMLEVPDVSPLWVEAMRTFHLVTRGALLRAGESTCHVQWGWFTPYTAPDGRLELRLNTPGGRVLKHQDEARTVVVPSPCAPGTSWDPADCQHPDLCGPHQLERWRAAATAAGIPTAPTDLMLPAVRRFPNHPDMNHYWTPGQLWVSDPIGAAVTAAIDRAAERGEVLRDSDIAGVGRTAARVQCRRFAEPWIEVALAAGFAPRHRFERVSAHGLRRGGAVQARRNGAPMAAVSFMLRHDGGATTPLYLDISDLEPLDVASLFDDLNLPAASWDELDLDRDDLGALLDPSVRVRTCQIPDPDRGLCPAPAYADVVRTGARNSMCAEHYVRHLDGATLVGPLRGRLPAEMPPPTVLCEVPHHRGFACAGEAVGTVIFEHQQTPACELHVQRYSKDQPLVGTDISAVCAVPNPDGSPCGDGGSLIAISLGGSRARACERHAERDRNGWELIAWKRPDRPRRISDECQVPNPDGAVCGRPFASHIVVEDQRVAACSLHYLRSKNGQQLVAWPRNDPRAKAAELRPHSKPACRP